MAFSELLAGRLRAALARKKGLEEKKLFGCVAFLLHGNVVLGGWKDSLLVRLGPERGEEALLEPHVRPFDITGRPMSGWVLVGAAGVTADEELKGWVRRAVAFARTLPAK